MAFTQIVPVVLAAGDSKRMGYPKALLPLGNGTFIGRILETLERLETALPRVVLGRDAAAVAPLIVGRARVLVNADPGRGQISSMQLALAGMEPGTAGCLFWPVDQPAVSEQTVRNLIRLFQASDACIAMPVCAGRRGHPALFHQALFEELLRVPVEAGPKGVVAAHASRTVLLPCTEQATVDDVDTPEDYLRLTGETPAEALKRSDRSV